MLIVNLNTLQTVNVLNFLDQIFSQLLNAQNAQNIMRSRCTFNQHIAFLDNIAVLNNQVTSFRNQIFQRFAFLRHNGNPLFGLIILAEFNLSVNIGNNRRIFRTTGLKQLGNTRQTTGNIFSLGAFSRNSRNNLTGLNFLPVFNRQNGIYRHIVTNFFAVVISNRLALFILEDNARLQPGAAGIGAPVDNRFGNNAGCFVNNFLNRNIVNQVNQLDPP